MNKSKFVSFNNNLNPKTNHIKLIDCGRTNNITLKNSNACMPFIDLNENRQNFVLKINKYTFYPIIHPDGMIFSVQAATNKDASVKFW